MCINFFKTQNFSEKISKVKIYRKPDTIEAKFIDECIIDIKNAGKVESIEIFDGDFEVICGK